MCAPEIRRKNTAALSTMLSLMTFIYVILLANYLRPADPNDRNAAFLISNTVLFMIEQVLYRFYFRKHPSRILWLYYPIIASIFSFGMYLSLYMGPDCYGAALCVTMVSIPMLIVDVPIRLIAIIFSADGILAIAYHFQLQTGGVPGDLLAVPTALFCSLLGIYCSYYIQQTNFSEVRNHMLLEIQRDTDAVTGALNRTAYERHLDTFADTGAPAGVVFADVNGLKQTNDLEGHDAGDALIRDAHQLLERYFGTENDRIYRIGGDEFVVIAREEPRDAFYARCHAMLTDPSRELISCGSVWTSKVSKIERVIHEAEGYMYVAKEAYYTTHPERDRRRN